MSSGILYIALLAQIIFIGAHCASELQPPDSQKQAIQANNTITTTNSANHTSKPPEASKPEVNGTLVESQSERLVRESNLQAEESQQTGQLASVLPPLASNETSQQQSRAPRQLVRNVASYYSPSSFSGGSGNSYMSISRDGSNRYQFGFDTESSLSRENQPEANLARQRREPRLMREETRLEDGTVVGRYGYTDPFNVFRIVQYVAGPEGYFATEDVGSSPGEGGKFQLNKQLAKRLDEARALRLTANRRSVGSSLPARTPKQPETSWLEAQESVKPAVLVASHESKRALLPQKPELLIPSASGHSEQPFRYATKINHLVGANGVSYATAFRPVPVRQVNVYQPVQPAASDALQRQHLQWEERRSRLPAPIYTPSMTSIPFATASTYADYNRQQVAPQTSSNVLESSPAWNLLNNNYQQQTSSIFIDHLGPPEATLPGHAAYRSVPAAKRLGQGIEENFRREAALLQSLRKETREQQQPPPVPARHPTMAYNYNSKPAQTHPEFMSSQFGVRAVQQQQWPRPEEQLNRNNYAGLALNQFDPPLYSPEVHEETRLSAQNEQLPPPVVYSSTVIHSEVAAERDYRPQRLSSMEPREVDLERDSSSDRKLVASAAAKAILLDPTKQSLKFNVDQIVGSSPEVTAGQGKALIIDHNSGGANEQLDRERVPSENANLREVDTQDAPAIIRYATRLTGLRQAELQSPPDLTVEDSEQISSVLRNGTTRAKLPDRSKKLSSIFKARTSTKKFGRLVQSASSGESSSEGSGVVTTTEPVPFAAKKRPNLREGSSTTTTSTTTTTTTPSPTESVVVKSKTIETTTETQQQRVKTSTPEVGAEPKPTAMVVDAMNPSNNMDRDLYEKIVKIQREIAAMSQTSMVTNATANNKEAAPIVASTDLTNDGAKNITSTEQPAAAAIATTTIASVPEVSTISEETQRSRNVSSSSETLEKSSKESPGSLEASSLASSTSFRQETDEKTNSLLTGPLMKMDNFVENGDFLANLTQDMDMFDSVRSSFANQQQATTTKAPHVESSSESSRSELAAAKSKSIEVAEETTTMEPSTLDTASRRKVKMTIKMIKTRKSESSSNTTGSGLEPNNQVALDTSGGARIENENKLEGEKHSGQQNATVSKQEVAVVVNKEITLRKNENATISSTERPTRSSTKANQSRLGRLVIKRGDKVVARFNGSEPIPDSLIPVAGNSSDIIVPDMPRHGLRIAVKRRFQPKPSRDNLATSSHEQLSSTTPSSSTGQLSSNSSENEGTNSTTARLIASSSPMVQPINFNETTISSIEKNSTDLSSRGLR